MSNTTNNLTPYTIAGSGVSLFIKPIAPFLFRDLERALPLPEPPLETIERADGSRETVENKAHPDYQAALNERATRANMMIADLCVELGTHIALTDEQKAEALAYRTTVERVTGVALAGSIETIYLRYIALASNDDLRAFIAAVMERIRPSEKKLTSGQSITAQPFAAYPSGADPLEKPEPHSLTS